VFPLHCWSLSSNEPQTGQLSLTSSSFLPSPPLFIQTLWFCLWIEGYACIKQQVWSWCVFSKSFQILFIAFCSLQGVVLKKGLQGSFDLAFACVRLHISLLGVKTLALLRLLHSFKALSLILFYVLLNLGMITILACLVPFFLFFSSTGFELRVSHLLGRLSTSWAIPPALCSSFYLLFTEGWFPRQD
jgi:hypothetical protein